MKYFGIFCIITSMFGATALAADDNTPVSEVEEPKRCESWKQERGNKYRKVPGSRLVCDDKEQEEK